MTARLFPPAFSLLSLLCILMPETVRSASSSSSSSSATPAAPVGAVTPVGAMREVMWGGRMEAVLDLDTIADRKHLYGLGPLDSLRGELLVADGKAFRSTVRPDGRMQVEETFASKAPFFVYARVRKWRRVELPDTLLSLPTLEPILNRSAGCRERPCAFRLAGKVREAGIHVVDLAPGARVASPADAHAGNKSFDLKDAKVEMVGFFSTRHQGVFTHHDSYLHAHLLTADRKMMGHADRAGFRGGEVELFVAEE